MPAKPGGFAAFIRAKQDEKDGKDKKGKGALKKAAKSKMTKADEQD
jgi:hypothetical protein